MHAIRLSGECADICLRAGGCYQFIVASRAHKHRVLDSLLSQVKVAIVGPDGGLISNLTLHENISLPAEYHRFGNDADRTQRLNELIQSLGEDGAKLRAVDDAHPARLSSFQKRLAGFLRAMLMEPEALVFDTLLDGISRADATKALRLQHIFHLCFPFRQVIFVNYADDPRVHEMVDETFHLPELMHA
jgi:ABC-type lipoprotein export system ATPase subunit